MYDFTRFEREFFPEWIAQFRSGDRIGDYSFAKGGPTCVYGTTDMLISKYIINDLELLDAEKDEWASCINQFQNPDTGYYQKTYTLHFKEHTLAYAIAALYLIDRKPQYPMHWKNNIIQTVDQREAWIRKEPKWSVIWSASHVVSGVLAALAMTGEAPDEFIDWYFGWLDREVDPKSGFWRRGLIHNLSFWKQAGLHDMAGAFHMYYIYEFFHRQWLYPEKIIDHTLRLQHTNGLWDKDVTYCVDLDGLYCLTRSSRNANNYRAADIRKAVEKYLQTAEKIFNDKEFFFNAYGNSHRLTGALAAIAECQKFYPELVKTSKPWRQSLDKACYI
jgi:hypothetical protein